MGRTMLLRLIHLDDRFGRESDYDRSTMELRL